MSKKQDSFYFENFITCSEYACQAAHMLEDAMRRLAAMGCRGCRILVARDNRRALRAYAGLHFSPVGQARLYDTDFVCFEKKLL